MKTYSESKKEVLDELKRLVETYEKKREAPPSAFGGPFQLDLKQLIQEIEDDTTIGRQFVTSFYEVKRNNFSP